MRACHAPQFLLTWWTRAPQALHEEQRIDGRRPFDLRPLAFEVRRLSNGSRGPSQTPTAPDERARRGRHGAQIHGDGNCEVQLGNTRALAVVTGELVRRCAPPRRVASCWRRLTVP
jgi:hypothetical protein